MTLFLVTTILSKLSSTPKAQMKNEDRKNMVLGSFIASYFPLAYFFLLPNWP